MFKLNIPITKSFQKNDKILVVEGIASDPTLDKDEERFELSALEKMVNCVNGGNIPIRIEHENKIYTDVGKWVSAGIENDKMVVKGEIDTELSLGNDVKVILGRGEALSLSVGGEVYDAGFEMDKALGKMIRVYKDVGLKEISIVKNPSNNNTVLAIGKSVDWDKLELAKSADGVKEFPYTTQAQQLIKMYNDMVYVSPEEFDKKTNKACASGKKKKMTYKTSDWGKDTLKVLEPWFESLAKSIEIEVCEDCGEEKRALTADDLKMIGQLVTIMTQVELPSDEKRPKILDDDNYWMNVSEEMEIVLFDRACVMPHHNLDFSLNKDLVLWQLKRAVDGQGYYQPKDFTVIISHLYRHLKALALLKNKKSEKQDVQKELSADELSLFKACSDYKEGILKEVPIYKGQVVNDSLIEKCAEAYTNYITNQNNTMLKGNKVTKEEEEVKETEVEETEVEDTETSEEVEEKEEKEEVEEKEEEEVEEKEDEEVVEEDEEEDTEKAKKKMPKKEGEETMKSQKVEVKFDKKEVDKLSKSFSEVEKSFTKMSEIVDGLVEKAKAVDTLEKQVKELSEVVAKQTEILSEVAKVSKGRKSVATYQVIEKNFSKAHDKSEATEKGAKEMEDGADFKTAYIQSKYGDQE